MKKFKFKSILVLVVITIFCNNAIAQKLQLNASSKIQVDYQPFSGLSTNAGLNVNISLSQSEQNNAPQSISNSNALERFRLRITPHQGTFIAVNENNDKLLIEFTSRQKNSEIQRFGNQYFEDIVLNLNSLQRNNNFSYTVNLPSGQFAKPGEYRLLLDMDIITSATNEIISNEQVVEVQVIVNAKLQANIAGVRTQKNGSKFALVDFGELESGESESVLLQIRGNTDANIILTSENNGRMKHKTDNYSFVNYNVSFDGTSSNLKSPLSVVRPVANNLKGSSYPLIIKVGDVRGAYAGRYQDIITIDVNPQ